MKVNVQVRQRRTAATAQPIKPLEEVAQPVATARLKTPAVEIKVLMPADNKDAIRSVLQVLTGMKWMGDVGASRDVVLTEFGESGKDARCGFDGDGRDRIVSIKLGDDEVNAKDVWPEGTFFVPSGT